MSEASADRPLAGQRALVTGANSGIGAAIAQAYGRAGAAVAINYVTEPGRAESLAEALRADGADAIAVRADVSREDEVDAMFACVTAEFGSVDILVNNAGLQRDAPATGMSLEQWRRVIDVNLTGQFLCARAALREFERRGREPARSSALGKILCIASVHDTIPWADHANYAASKGGVLMLMKTLAQEWAPKGVRINAISPGAIRTPINTASWDTPQALESLLALIPYRRVGAPEDVARAAVWLASDASDYVVGTTLYVDGGMTLYPAFAHGG